MNRNCRTSLLLLLQQYRTSSAVIASRLQHSCRLNQGRHLINPSYWVELLSPCWRNGTCPHPASVHSLLLWNSTTVPGSFNTNCCQRDGECCLIWRTYFTDGWCKTFRVSLCLHSSGIAARLQLLALICFDIHSRCVYSALLWNFCMARTQFETARLRILVSCSSEYISRPT